MSYSFAGFVEDIPDCNSGVPLPCHYQLTLWVERDRVHWAVMKGIEDIQNKMSFSVLELTSECTCIIR